MGIEDFLAKAAETQLSNATDAVKDGAWLDDMVAKLKAGIDNSQLNDTAKQGSHLAVAALEQNKSKIAGLGVDALNLVVHQVAAGKSDEAVETYVQSLGSAQAIVDAMDRGTLGLIAAKRQLDQWHADAWDVVKSIGEVAMQLLPLLLALA
jgi:hypothetical protein